MKSYWVLLVLAFLLAFLSGYEWFATSREEEPIPAEALDALLGRFLRHHRGQRLALSKLLPSEQGDSLLDPGTLLPQLANFPYDQLLALERDVAAGTLERAPVHPGLQKAWRWHRALAGIALPADFFAQPPYVHPTGGSYVRRAWESGKKEFKERSWIQAHLLWVHAGELALLSSGAPDLLDPGRRILADLEPEQLHALHERDGVVLSSHHLLISRTGVRPEEDLYDVHPRRDWDAFLAGTAVRLVPHQHGVPALARRGHLDWQPDSRLAKDRRLTARKIEFAGILGMALGLGFLFVRGLSNRFAEATRRRFMLQTLTHELRTPLASARLSLERLRDGFDQLGDAQTAFLRLCDDMARLDRVVQISRRYLLDSADGRLLELAPVVVESPGAYIGELIERVVPENPDAIELVMPEQEAPATFDPYWVGVCITNLLENALRHGRPPVTVRASREADTFTLQVQDAGTCALSLEEMMKPFTRGPASAGSGLGLSIIASVLTQIEGNLTYTENPTCFTMRWRVR
jgi:signal transduction histidine kinase